MFLELTLRRNPTLVEQAIALHQAGKIPANSYVIDLDAVERNAASAPAWNELGVTLRMRGRFKDAAEAYRSAIAADGAYAPAYRNLGVLLDLYLEDPAGALAAFERYKELTGEQKPVSGWIAEVRQRAGKSTPAATAPGTASPGIATPGSPAPSAAPGSAAPGGGQGPARDQTPTPQGKPPAASSAAQPERSGE